MCGHQVRSYGSSVSTDDRTPDTTSGASPTDHIGTQQYEIRVKGHLESRWVAWFDGLSLTNEDDGITVIRGPVVDQAALHGLLHKLRDVGIPLVSLTQLPPDASTERQALRTQEGTDMTTTTRTSAGERTPRTPLRKTALIAGVAYIATFVFSIPVKFGLWADVLDKPDFIFGAGSGGGVLWGALFEVLTALACIATAVSLYPVAKRHSERAALGFVTSRVLEASMIFVGVLSILAVYTLRQDVAGTAGADTGALLTARHALVAIHDWTFLIGPGVIAGLNALLIGSVMYRSRLLPRWIPTLGLIGAPLLLASCTATLFGAWEQTSGPALLLVLPIAIWELSFGIYMTVKGFKPSTVALTSIDDTAAVPTVAA